MGRLMLQETERACSNEWEFYQMKNRPKPVALTGEQILLDQRAVDDYICAKTNWAAPCHACPSAGTGLVSCKPPSTEIDIVCPDDIVRA